MSTGRATHAIAGIARSRGAVIAALAVCGLVLSLLGPSTASGAVAGDGVRSASTFGAGMVHSLVVKEDGTLWCWGVDVIDEETGDYYRGILVPTQVGADSDWAVASAGPFSSLAIKADGSLWALQFAATLGPVEGGLDEGAGAPAMTIVASRVGIDTDWVAVADGGLVSLALKAGGSLWHVGYEFEDDSEDAEVLVTTQRVGEDGDWTAISSGYWNALALKSDGTLWSVELGLDFGSLEDLDSLDDIEVTVDLYSFSADSDWMAVALGGDHVLALKTDGSLWSMGDNTYGQLGDGTTSNRDDFVRVGGQNDWVAVAAGYLHSLALRADGSLWAWGRNEDGQVGDGATFDQHSPVRVGQMSDWFCVSAGYAHSLAIDGDGAVWAWGDNSSGQLGDGTTEDRTAPVKVFAGAKLPAWAAQPVHFTDISASPYRAAIRSLAQRGIISGFGDGTFGPDRPVTRQQFAKMIVLGLGLQVTEGGEPLGFPDVAVSEDDLYPDDYVAVAAASGLVTGFPDGTFGPQLDITRAQVVTIIVRAAQTYKPEILRTPPPNWVGGLPTSDPTHGANVGIAQYSGLLLGIDPASFALDAPATRGEIAQIIMNLRTTR
jgi:hypothetical protein